MSSYPGAARLLGSGNPSEYLPLSILLTELVNGRDKANSPFSYLSKRMERNTGFGLVSERLPTHARTCTTSLHKETCSYCPSLFPPLGAAPTPSWPRWRGSREIPSFCILWISVVRFRPSVAAAPFGPPITQPTASSVRRIRARSESLKVVAPEERMTPGVPNVGKGFGSTPWFERITARSIRFCSSRIFPGHAYELRADIVSAGMCSICS